MAATPFEITMPRVTLDTALPIQPAMLTAALQKMEQGHIIALAFFGGLDSSLCVVLAREKYPLAKGEAKLITATAQPGEAL